MRACVHACVRVRACASASVCVRDRVYSLSIVRNAAQNAWLTRPKWKCIRCRGSRSRRSRSSGLNVAHPKLMRGGDKRTPTQVQGHMHTRTLHTSKHARRRTVAMKCVMAR